MQMGKLKIDMVAGELVLAVEVKEGAEVKVMAPMAVLLMPAVEALEAKIVAGEIDPIKGTDLDKEVLMKGIVELKKLLA